MFTFLTNDLQMAFDKQVALENEVMKLKQTILEKDSLIHGNAHFVGEYECQMKINADLLKKINEAETNYEKLNTIVKGWCQSSKNLDKMIASQIPAQTKAILGNDLNSALESSLSSILEADDLS